MFGFLMFVLGLGVGLFAKELVLWFWKHVGSAKKRINK
jgi:hypothetical protein